MRRGAWTSFEVTLFRIWHNKRLRALGYPPSVVEELAAAREKWLSQIPIRRVA